MILLQQSHAVIVEKILVLVIYKLGNIELSLFGDLTKELFGLVQGLCVEKVLLGEVKHLLTFKSGHFVNLVFNMTTNSGDSKTNVLINIDLTP